MARLLFITANRIGDAVLSTAALEEARARLGGGPEVVIACGALPAPLFRATPGLARVEILSKQKGGWRDLWRRLRKDRFDLAVDLRGSLTTYLLSAKRRIVHKKRPATTHKLDELAETMGAPGPLNAKLHIDARARDDAMRLAPDGRVILALGPGANFIGKQWPGDRFAQLAMRLVGTGGPMAGARVALLGARLEHGVTSAIAKDLAAVGVEAIDAAGALDLLANAALLERAALFIGNDSGLMHLSAAVGAPTLGLFGPSQEWVYGPRGVRARSVRGPRSFQQIIDEAGHIPSVTVSLMQDLSVEAVEAVARELLAGVV
jgi:lipopolysaccharide export system permease protein